MPAFTGAVETVAILQNAIVDGTVLQRAVFHGAVFHGAVHGAVLCKKYLERGLVAKNGRQKHVRCKLVSRVDPDRTS